MKRDISSTSTPDIWNLTDTAPVLEIYADQDFDTSDGQRVLAGDVSLGTLCRRSTCSVAAGVLSVPAISNIDTTEDSPDNQRATYSTYLRPANQQLIPWLLQFPIPPSITTPVAAITWTTLRIHKAGILARTTTETYTKQEILNLIEQAIQDALGAGGIIAKGVVAMVAGVAAVSNVLVTPDANIQLTGQDAGVNGALSVSDRVPGSGFTVISDNGADEGVAGWVMLAA